MSLHTVRAGRRNVVWETCVRFFSVTLQDTVCTLLSRTTNTTTNTSHLEEREGELELQRLEKKDEPGEAASERCAGVFLFFFFFQLEPSSVMLCTKSLAFPSACVLMWHGCTLQELAGRVRGQRLQQQHSVHSCLLRGAVCRGHLHHHRRALWTDHQQTLHNEGEVCSSDGVELHIHWHFNAEFQYPYFYTVWYAKNIFSLSNAVCRKYKNVSSHHSLHAFLPMLTHNPLRSCGYVTSP